MTLKHAQESPALASFALQLVRAAQSGDERAIGALAHGLMAEQSDMPRLDDVKGLFASAAALAHSAGQKTTEAFLLSLESPDFTPD